MAVTALEARGQILDDLAEAGDQIGLAVACLGEAYEQLDEGTAERLETELFRPVQKAYGRAKRTHAQFAERFGLEARPFDALLVPSDAKGVKALIERALGAAAEADHKLGELQDSMLPIEAGDPELRAGLAEVRDHLDHLSTRARELTRRLGR